MNVLVVSTRPPTPAVRGDQVVLVNRLRELHGLGHRLFLCYAQLGSAEPEGIEEVRRWCAGVFPHRLGAVRRAFNLVTHGAFGRAPLQVALFRDPRFSALVREIVARERIDVVNAFLIRSFLAVEALDRPVVVDLIDSMLLNVRRRLETASPWLRPVLAIEARRLERYERSVCERAAASVVVAQADRDAIAGPRVFVVPLGVDTREFHPEPGARVPRRIVFTGNMRYHANQAALAWFVASCWPALRLRFPDAELCVAGHGAEAVARDLASVGGVRLVGRVASMGAFLRTADVSIAPMRSGSGMQYKILEAMACGVPTVLSPLGRGGIRATHGVETLVADGADAFVEAVATLLLDEGRRQAIADAALRFVRANHGWTSNAREFERIARDGAARFHAPHPGG